MIQLPGAFLVTKDSTEHVLIFFDGHEFWSVFSQMKERGLVKGFPGARSVVAR